MGWTEHKERVVVLGSGRASRSFQDLYFLYPIYIIYNYNYNTIIAIFANDLMTSFLVRRFRYATRVQSVTDSNISISLFFTLKRLEDVLVNEQHRRWLLVWRLPVCCERF